MWNVLPRFALIKLIAYSFSILLVSGILIKFRPIGFTAENFMGSLFLVTPITFLFGIMVCLLAKILWKPIWRLPFIGDYLNRNVCPDLNGVWKGEIISSFKKDEEAITKKVEMIIEADFIGFKIKLNSMDNYLRSTVVQSEIYKDPRSKDFYITYIFEATVDTPEPTDDSKFDGAAKLVVRHSDNGIELDGTYWTNRAWQRGLHTAGTISLTRKANSMK